MTEAPNPYQPAQHSDSDPLPDKPADRSWAIVFYIFVSTPILAIALSIVGMLTTGYGTQGSRWVLAGLAVIPTTLGCIVYTIRHGDWKQGLIRGISVGVSVAVAWYLFLITIVVVGVQFGSFP